MEIGTTDYHTAGEPFRIVAEGAVEVPGSTVRERRELAATTEEVDRVRRLLCHEPRGHADMYGCFLVPPDDSGADLGVLFWHKDGYSTACGHGTIALGAWAVESGRIVAASDGDVDVTIDVPSGRVVARVRCRAGAVEAVAFRNVPSFVVARGVRIADAEVDIAYGGALYAFVSADSLGVHVDPADLPELIRIGREIKHAFEGHELARHPADDRLSGIYGTVIHEEVEPLHRRNVAIFADGEVDRSPTRIGDVRTHRAVARRRRPDSGPDVAQRLDHRHHLLRPGARHRPTRACSPRSRAWRTAPASTGSYRGPRSARHRLRPAMTAPAALPYLDSVEIARRLGPAGAFDAVEGALLAGLDPEGDPPRAVLEVDGGQLLVMPSVAAGHPVVKLVTVGGDPRVQGICVVFDAATLAPVALVDAIALTNLRTAAVSAVAVHRLAPPDAARLLVFGRGPQAKAHVEAMRRIRPIEHVDVLGRDRGDVDVDGLVSTADVICCCTAAREPLFDGGAVADHATVVAIGSHEPDARETDSALAARSTVVVESLASARVARPATSSWPSPRVPSTRTRS